MMTKTESALDGFIEDLKAVVLKHRVGLFTTMNADIEVSDVDGNIIGVIYADELSFERLTAENRSCK